MTPVAEASVKTPTPWSKAVWFGLLLAICYAPVLFSLAQDWERDADMGHGFFVPAIAAYIVWQKRGELLAAKPQPNWWGLVLEFWGAVQLMIGTLGAEVFTTRVAFIISVIG